MMTRKPLFKSVSLVLMVLFSGSLLHAVNAADWTLEDVLHKIEEANGGLETVEDVSNLRIRGEVISEEAAYDFLLLKKRPDMVRIHILLKGRSVESGFDGDIAWRRVWVNGVDRVMELTDADLARANLDLDFDGPLIGDPLPGTTRRLEGVERIDRVDYFIVVTENDYSRKRHYIDSRNFREWKTITEFIEDGEVTATTTATYSGYKRHNSIWVAHRIERILADGKKETVVVTEAEVDPGILDRAFRIPKQWSPAS